MDADYVIVGAGSGGSALGYRLAEAGHRVAIIEFGGTDWGPFIEMPAALSTIIVITLHRLQSCEICNIAARSVPAEKARTAP